MSKITEKTKVEKETKVEVGKSTYYFAVGRRKEAVARVRLYVVANEDKVTVHNKTYTKGQIIVNDREIEKYFPGEVYKKMYLEPFRTTNTLHRFVVTIQVRGGGLGGQMWAVVLGIARALEKVDQAKFRPILKKRDFLTRDARIKQRRKAGFAGKARKKKQSPKR